MLQQVAGESALHERAAAASGITSLKRLLVRGERRSAATLIASETARVGTQESKFKQQQKLAISMETAQVIADTYRWLSSKYMIGGDMKRVPSSTRNIRRTKKRKPNKTD